MRAMLVNIVENGHSSRAYIEGYYTGGKTGTAQIASGWRLSQRRINPYLHRFGADRGPGLCHAGQMDSPKDVTYAEGSVVPVWRDIADFILNTKRFPRLEPNNHPYNHPFMNYEETPASTT
jgi:cell division protein FtsI/penicillin-binding protein 2